MVHESSRRLAIQLKEVLDRIDLPPIESIPDAQTMAKAEFKRWTIPGTEIQIAQVKTGPRAGEYLFTPETLNRLPEFYAKVKDLPYKPGASVGWYDFSTYSPVGVAMALHRIVPPRWLLDAPRHRTSNHVSRPTGVALARYRSRSRCRLRCRSLVFSPQLLLGRAGGTRRKMGGVAPAAQHRNSDAGCCS